MKTWTRTFGTALTLALFAGCTVTVGRGSGDDSDDIDFSDKSEKPDTTEDTTDPPQTSSPSESTSEPIETSAEQSTSEPTSSSTNETSSDPGDTSDPVFNECTPDDGDGCNTCVKTYCEMDWEDCCGDPECMAEWTALYSCMLDSPTDDPWYDFDTCAASVSSTGDALDLHPAVQNITSCVNEEYMGAPDDYHAPGDGTCTLDCYYLPTLGNP